MLLVKGNEFSTCLVCATRASVLAKLTPMRSSTFILRLDFSTNDSRRYKPKRLRRYIRKAEGEREGESEEGDMRSSVPTVC